MCKKIVMRVVVVGCVLGSVSVAAVTRLRCGRAIARTGASVVPLVVGAAAESATHYTEAEHQAFLGPLATVGCYFCCTISAQLIILCGPVACLLRRIVKDSK